MKLEFFIGRDESIPADHFIDNLRDIFDLILHHHEICLIKENIPVFHITAYYEDGLDWFLPVLIAVQSFKDEGGITISLVQGDKYQKL